MQSASYSNNVAALIMEPQDGIFRIRVLALFSLFRQLWEPAPLTHGDLVVLLLHGLSLLVNI